MDSNLAPAVAEESQSTDNSQDNVSALDVLSLRLERSGFDKMSLASDDSGDRKYLDASDGHEGVAINAPVNSAAQVPDVSAVIDQFAATGHQHQDSQQNCSEAVLESFLQPVANYTALLPIAAQTGTFISLSNSDFSGTLPAISWYTDAAAASYNGNSASIIGLEELESYKTTPIFTSSVGAYLESAASQIPGQGLPFAQHGLLGVSQMVPSLIEIGMSNSIQPAEPENESIIANMEPPWSAFICGSQGAGKSHTLSCLLENSLMNDSQVGRLPNPLAAMVFHYDAYTNATCSQTSEAAYLCSSGIPVTVLVSPSNIWAMTKLYTNLQGLPPGSPVPTVLPLYLSENMLDISTILKLMAVDPNADDIPLYMETVMSILREMAMEGKGAGAFSYTEFRHRVDSVHWVRGQTVALNLRLQLLDSFLAPTQFTKTSRPAPAKENIWAFQPGTLTIVDLSDPFVNANDACALFSICLSLFLEDRGECGRVVAMDEAHKFLLQSGAARALTNDLTSVIRQQRHTGTRVLIATQEPTLSPELIDLANVTFVHRFTSPAWYTILKKHLAGASKHDSRNSENSLFETIVELRTGEALMFCPTALVSINSVFANTEKVRRLGDGYLQISVRKRLTADGGKSVLASDRAPKQLVSLSHQIPMHIVMNPPLAPSNSKCKGKLCGKDHQNMPVQNHQHPLRSASVTKSQMPGSSHVAQATSLTNQSSANGQSTKPTQNNAAFQSLKERIEQETRVQMRRNYQSMGWYRPAHIQWDLLKRDVETALKIKHVVISYSNGLMTAIKTAGTDEQARCNRENAQEMAEKADKARS